MLTSPGCSSGSTRVDRWSRWATTGVDGWSSPLGGRPAARAAPGGTELGLPPAAPLPAGGLRPPAPPRPMRPSRALLDQVARLGGAGFEVVPLTEFGRDDFEKVRRVMTPNRSGHLLWWRDGGSPPKRDARIRTRRRVRDSPQSTGLLAHRDAERVCWAALAARVDLSRRNRGRGTAPLGRLQPVWLLHSVYVLAGH